MKILWIGDAVVPTGFSRVTHAVCDRLAAKGHSITVLGINYNGDPHDYAYRIYPAQSGGDFYGYTRLAQLVERHEPDLVVIFNDVWMVGEYANVLFTLREKHRFRMVCYTPIDGPGLFPAIALKLEALNLVMTYTQFGSKVLRSSGFRGPVEVVPHGVDLDTFYPYDKATARKRFGIPEDAFVVGNANRNQPRKRIDLTIRGFLEFAKSCPEAHPYLYLYMGSKDMGWDIGPLFHQVAQREGVTNATIVFNSAHSGIGNAVDSELRQIFSLFDVNVNTCSGEGWGLVAFETAACRVAQIQPDHTACAELWRDHGILTPVKMWVDDENFGIPRGYIDTHQLAGQIRKLYRNQELRDEWAQDAYDYAHSKEFSWDLIAERFEAIFERQVRMKKAA